AEACFPRGPGRRRGARAPSFPVGEAQAKACVVPEEVVEWAGIILGFRPRGGRRAVRAIHRQGRPSSGRAAPPRRPPPATFLGPADEAASTPSKTLSPVLSLSEPDGWIVWTKGADRPASRPAPEGPHKTEGAMRMRSSLPRMILASGLA